MSYDKSRYQWLKEHGICVQCGQRDAFPGYVRCPECIEKVGIASAKCRCDKEKRIKYNKHENERRKQRYKERKIKHLCTRCGKQLTEDYKYSTCVSCRKRRSEKRRTGKDYGEAFRERIKEGVCMYCGSEVVSGYNFCEKHLKNKREIIKKTNLTASEKWRGEITRQWENAKLKSSKNG
ncbi:MAG: hypothetical protein KH034_02795 [Lachnospiraceae bacterium]|nr:hypothetical protein [Lachnospiraceae bacterium]